MPGLGLSSHAPAFPSDQTDQCISVDSTVELVLDVPPDKDQETDGQDSSSRGQWKDRPAFPGLALSVAEDTTHGTSQGMSTWKITLVAHPAAKSSPQAVAFSSEPEVYPYGRSTETRTSPDTIPTVGLDLLPQQEHPHMLATAPTSPTGTCTTVVHRAVKTRSVSVHA